MSHDPSLRTLVERADGSTCTALDVQWEFFRLAGKYADDHGLDGVGGEAVGRDVLAHWEQSSRCSRTTRPASSGQVDWVTKRSLLDAYVDRDGLEWNDPKLRLIDLQYHDLRPERSLYRRLVDSGKVTRLVDPADVIEAISEPPETTRAYFRGQCLKRWPDSVVAANWDSIILDVGSDPLQRIPMMEPLRGTKAHVEALFEGCRTPPRIASHLVTPADRGRTGDLTVPQLRTIRPTRTLGPRTAQTGRVFSARP